MTKKSKSTRRSVTKRPQPHHHQNTALSTEVGSEQSSLHHSENVHSAHEPPVQWPLVGSHVLSRFLSWARKGELRDSDLSWVEDCARNLDELNWLAMSSRQAIFGRLADADALLRAVSSLEVPANVNWPPALPAQPSTGHGPHSTPPLDASTHAELTPSYSSLPINPSAVLDIFYATVSEGERAGKDVVPLMAAVKARLHSGLGLAIQLSQASDLTPPPKSILVRWRPHGQGGVYGDAHVALHHLLDSGFALGMWLREQLLKIKLKAAQDQAETDKIISIQPNPAIAGSVVTLNADPANPFTPIRPKLAVRFSPHGIGGSEVTFSPTTIQARVPYAAGSGCVWLEWNYITIEDAFDDNLLYPIVSEYLRGLGVQIHIEQIGRPATGQHRPPYCSAKAANGRPRNHADIWHLPSLKVSVNGLDTVGRKNHYLIAGDSVTVDWSIVSDAPGTRVDVLCGADHQSTHSASGQVEFVATKSGPLRVVLTDAAGHVERSVNLSVRVGATLLPEKVFLLQNEAATLEVRLGMPTAIQMTVELVSSSPNNVEVSQQVVVPAGAISALATVKAIGPSTAIAGYETARISISNIQQVGLDCRVFIGEAAPAWQILSSKLDQLAIHLFLQRDGKLLVFSPHKDDIAKIDDFQANALTVNETSFSSQNAANMPALRNLFCAGHCILGDGRLLSVGGSYRDLRLVDYNNDLALQHRTQYKEHLRGADHDVHIYNPALRTWTRLADMPEARWYPSCVTLPDGRAFVCGGWRLGTTDFVGRRHGDNPTYALFDPSTQMLSGATPFWEEAILYPYLCVLPGGDLFVFSGNQGRVYSGNQFVHTASCLCVDKGSRTYPMQGSQVILPLEWDATEARILLVGGSTAEPGTPSAQAPASSTAEVMRYGQGGSLSVEAVIPLHQRRFMSDAVLLPDGGVIVVGGAGRGMNNNSGEPALGAELLRHGAMHFESMESASIPRYYHSSAILLADGRVLTAGSTGSKFDVALGGAGSHLEYRVEIFTPPSLRGVGTMSRPVLEWAPSKVQYGQTFDVQTSDPGSIARASLVRASSVTHTLNTDQRCVFLPILKTYFDGLTLRSPRDGTVAPPGQYMLFLMDAQGVPSKGRFVQIS